MPVKKKTDPKIRSCEPALTLHQLTIFHMGGGADSARPQIAFFITSFRDAVGPQNLAKCPKI